MQIKWVREREEVLMMKRDLFALESLTLQMKRLKLEEKGVTLRNIFRIKHYNQKSHTINELHGGCLKMSLSFMVGGHGEKQKETLKEMYVTRAKSRKKQLPTFFFFTERVNHPFSSP